MQPPEAGRPPGARQAPAPSPPAASLPGVPPWPPAADALPFLVDGLRRGELAWLAEALLASLADPTAATRAPAAARPVPRGAARRPRLVLLAEDRAAVAAAILASLTTGPELVLPHAPTAQVLAELEAWLPCDGALVDGPRALPPGLPSWPLPQAASGTSSLPAALRAPDEVLLHLFTGGSTGRPRVWSKTLANLLGEAAFLARRFGIGPEDRILATVPPCHIFGLLFSVLLPLVSGASVVRETVFFPREVDERCSALGCTVLISVPVHYRALAAAGMARGRLRLAFTSSAPLAEAEALAFQQTTGLGIVEVYGSTETGGIATRCRADGEQSWTPFPVVRWRTDDERLCVDSPFLSPELPRDAQGLFRTGDRVSLLPGGRFQLLGRADGIVKVGGKRVDLGEVEEKLRSLAGVTDALVLALPEAGGRGQGIAALLVSGCAVEEVLARLRPLLPPHALPRRVRRVAQLPLTNTGKRDREAAEQLFREPRR